MVVRFCLVLLAAVSITEAVSAAPVKLPNGTNIEEVNFERHVASLFSRLGCNAGACHGSFKGKGGLRLSLFGHSPESDYAAFTRDSFGRRIDLANPDQSLLLLKATGQVAHEGGQRFAKDSWQYQVIRSWIAQGTKWASNDSSVKSIEVEPRSHQFHKPGETVRLRVRVEFGDGSRHDMTPFCDFRAKDDFVADVSSAGDVQGRNPGDTFIVVGYRGNLVTANVLVPLAVDNSFTYPAIPEVNFIDRAVFAKLKQLNMVPSALSSDTEFLRRVTLDTIGTLPKPEEIRAFCADPSSDKRTRKIDALLAHPMHAAMWATKWCDITGNNLDVQEDPPELGPKRAKMWHDWFRKRFADNVPYDQIVRGVLTATSRDGLDLDHWLRREIELNKQASNGFQTDYANRPSLDLFWRRLANDDFFPLEQMAELTATAFLGVRLECAQCHKHPYDRWTQSDYRAFANVFAQTKFGSSPEVTAAMSQLLEERRHQPPDKRGQPLPRLREVYVSNQPLRRLPKPGTREWLPPKALGGPEFDYQGDARAKLCDWLIRPENPTFAQSFVNRVWAMYFGVGIVDPLDNFSVANPPSNTPLLEALARDFTEHGYNIGRLEKNILLSRVYQLSSIPNPTGATDRNNYAHSYVRRMSAEVVVDVLNTALGTKEDFGPGIPPGSLAIEIGPNRVQDAHLANVFRIFGRPARTQSCDCERSLAPAVPQVLFLMSDPKVLEKITQGRLNDLLAQKKSDAEIIEELFLATLSRFPSISEKSAALEYIGANKDRMKAFADVVWAQINTREFILNQ